MNELLRQQNILILMAFGLSALFELLIIPLIVRFSKCKGLYDHPDVRKIHKSNILRLGGISFFPTMTWRPSWSL